MRTTDRPLHGLVAQSSCEIHRVSFIFCGFLRQGGRWLHLALQSPEIEKPKAPYEAKLVQSTRSQARRSRCAPSHGLHHRVLAGEWRIRVRTCRMEDRHQLTCGQLYLISQGRRTGGFGSVGLLNARHGR